MLWNSNMDRLAVFFLILVQGLSQQLLAYAANCGKTSNTGQSSGAIEVPTSSSSNSYSKNMDCSYDIRVPVGKGVKLMWNKFDVKGSMPYCSSADYVEIYIGCSRKSIGRYCSDNMNSLPHDMFSGDSCMRIKFHSDGSKEGSGFKVSFSSFSLFSRLSDLFDLSCSYMSSKTSTADTIHSPQWPLAIPSNRNCHWKIRVGDDRGIKIAVMDFNLRYDRGCDDNKVKVKGGDEYKSYDRSGTILSSMCGKKQPFYFTSTKDQIYIRFKLSYTSGSSYRGFMIGYVVYQTDGARGGVSNNLAMIVAPIIAGLVLLGCCCFCLYKRRMQASRAHAHAPVAYQAAPSQPVHKPYPVSGGHDIAPPPPASYGPTPGAVGAGYPYPPPQGGQMGPLPGKEPYPPPSYPTSGYPAAPPYPQQPPAQPYPPPMGGVPPYQTAPPPQMDAPPYPAGPPPGDAPPYPPGALSPGNAPPYPTGPPPPSGVAPYPTGPPPPGGVAPYPAGPSALPPP